MISLPGGGHLSLSTERIFSEHRTRDIVLCMYPTRRILDLINDLNNARAIIVVPWTEDEKEEWIRTWNPQIIGEKSLTPQPLDINPGVEMALDALTNRINLSTGLTHPSDKESTIQIFKELHENNIPFIPEDLKIWALRNSWTSSGANQLRDIARRILDGRRFRTGNVFLWNREFINSILRRARGN